MSPAEMILDWLEQRPEVIAELAKGPGRWEYLPDEMDLEAIFRSLRDTNPALPWDQLDGPGRTQILVENFL